MYIHISLFVSHRVGALQLLINESKKFQEAMRMHMFGISFASVSLINKYYISRPFDKFANMCIHIQNKYSARVSEWRRERRQQAKSQDAQHTSYEITKLKRSKSVAISAVLFFNIQKRFQLLMMWGSDATAEIRPQHDDDGEIKLYTRILSR